MAMLLRKNLAEGEKIEFSAIATMRLPDQIVD